ncbi:PEGA domain-containing protein [bacterium]|nr:PEGA domain-containing protein [bacterium]
MTKNQLISLITLFILTLSGLGTWFYLIHHDTSGHFYLAAHDGTAQISLGSFSLGTAPITDYLLPIGTYQLHITTDYYTFTHDVTLNAAAATVVDWWISDQLATSHGVIYEALALPYQAQEVIIETSPTQALVTIDGQKTYSGYSPLRQASLSTGDHQAVIELPGYQTLTLPFSIHDNYQTHLFVQLAQDQTISQ